MDIQLVPCTNAPGQGAWRGRNTDWALTATCEPWRGLTYAKKEGHLLLTFPKEPVWTSSGLANSDILHYFLFPVCHVFSHLCFEFLVSSAKDPFSLFH